MNIEIIMKDLSIRKFPHEPRAGGSYTKTIEYVEGFVVITDEFYKTISIPTSDIKEIKTWPDRY